MMEREINRNDVMLKAEIQEGLREKQKIMESRETQRRMLRKSAQGDTQGKERERPGKHSATGVQISSDSTLLLRYLGECKG